MVLAEVVEGDEVAAREVEDVDVVADGGAVFGGVVCGEFCEHAFTNRGTPRGLTAVLPSPNTSSLSRFPIATCASKGSRLYGTPCGSSPMTPLGCEPAGLK